MRGGAEGGQKERNRAQMAGWREARAEREEQRPGKDPTPKGES